VTFGVVLIALGLASPWRPVGSGVWQREMPMASQGPLSPVRVHAVRLAPSRVSFELDTATKNRGTSPGWAVERVTRDALVAVNTGQFIGGVVWGWVVQNGAEASPPGSGTMAMSFVVDSAGIPSMLTPGEVARARGHVRLAFQSYPALLTGDGELPFELQAPGRGVDLDHRDSRLAIGMLADGSVIIALTRFTGLGTAGETLPWGPTVVEMAEFMRALGCRRAMMLDGGISSQMAVRQADGSVRQWTNWRKVPMGLLVRKRTTGVP
jgi:hypothetical protein